VDTAGWRFEVLKLEGRRIDQVMIRKTAEDALIDGG
jgi:CBS domain containing-hemolysin-like protein